MVTNECALYVALEMAPIRFIIPRLHDATGCQTGCTTGLTTVLNEQPPLFVQPVVSCVQTFNRLSNRFDNRLYRVNGAYDFVLQCTMCCIFSLKLIHVITLGFVIEFRMK